MFYISNIYKILFFIIVLIIFSVLFRFTIKDHNDVSNVTNTKLYNVKDFGAKGDGKNDDTSSIRAAIRTAIDHEGGTVYFSEGSYLVTSTIDVPKGVSIIGEGYKNTILLRTDEKVEALLKLSGKQVVNNITLNSQIGVLPVGNDISISNTKFTCLVQGVQNAVTIYRLTVENSIFEDCGYGILSNINPSFDVKILNTHFKDIKADGIEINAASQRWLIEDCIFEDHTSKSRWAGFGVGVAMSAKDITIRDSVFNNIIGQGVHVEDKAEVSIIGSTFKNNGFNNYPGSPEADIAVLSNAIVKVKDSIFYESDNEYSDIAIYNTDKPVGGTAVISESKFYNKTISSSVTCKRCEFLAE